MKGKAISEQLYVDILGKPLDSRTVVETIQERNAIAAGYRYKGMVVYIRATHEYFKFDYNGNDTKLANGNNNNWHKISMHDHENLPSLALIGTNVKGQFTWSGEVITGKVGEIGPQGSQGPLGVGTQGPIGSQGSQGTQGRQGLTGAGTQGTTGSQGPQGNQGTQGQTGIGTQGVTGSGSQGPQGTQGRQGFQGPIGSQGFQGNAGVSNVAGPQGINGTQGFQGFQGIAGVSAGGSGLVLTTVTDVGGQKIYVKASDNVVISKSGNKVTITRNGADLQSCCVYFTGAEVGATAKVQIDFDGASIETDYLNSFLPQFAAITDVGGNRAYKNTALGNMNVNPHTIEVTGLTANTACWINLSF